MDRVANKNQATDGQITNDRRTRRISALLEISGLFGRFAEATIVLLVGLVTIWLTDRPFGLNPIDQYVRAVWLSTVIYALSAELSGCYDVDARFSLRLGWTRIIVAWLGCCATMLTLAFLMKFSVTFSRGWTLLWFTSVGASLTIVRGLATIGTRRMKSQGLFNQRVAILGCGEQSDRLVRYITTSGSFTIDIVGCYDEAKEKITGESGALYRGNTGRLLADVRAGRIDQVMIAMPYATEERLQDIVGKLSMLPVLTRLVPDLSSFTFSGQSMVMLGNLPMMTIFERPISGTHQILKRIEDLLIATLLLVVVAPFLIIVAIAIKVESSGPVFFFQDREGFNHQKFRIWKFRSMRIDMLEYNEINQVRRGDKRVTRVGRIIRATSIDEIPQLVNVLIGNMSIVGPRPHAPSTKVAGKLFSEAVLDYAARHRVKPGITGWAQVNGWRGETDTNEKLLKRIECDLFYIEHWSIMFDLYIIMRTFLALLLPKSAY